MTAPTVNGVDSYARLGGLLVPTYALAGRPDARPDVAETAPVPVVVEPVSAQVDERPDEVAETPETVPVAASTAPVKVGRGERRRQRRQDAARDARDALMNGRTKRVEKWTARAAEARQLRALLMDPDVQAVRLMRQRARWTVMAWSALVFALAFTMVNVQRFAAGSAEQWSPTWAVAWVVDPAFSILLVGLLIARGQLSAVQRSVHERTVVVVEYALLASTAAMNVMPTLTHRYAGGWAEQVMQVVLHLLIPGLAFAAASVITIVQDHFAAAITALTDGPSGRLPEGINLQQQGSAGEVSADDRKLLDDVRTAIGAGDLEPDPSGYAIYRRVMGSKGDKTRAYRVAPLVNGWRPAVAR